MSQRTRRLTSYTMIAGVALAASLAGLFNELVQDDVALIVNNPRAHDLLHLRDLFTSAYWPRPFPADLYRPVTTLLLALEYTLGAGTPLVFRITSYVLYAAIAIGLLSFAQRLVPRNIALGAALIFAAHPLHVEAVALGVGQSELLVALASIVATILYLHWRRSAVLAPWQWSALSALYIAACLSKEQGFVLPALLLCVELLLVTGPTADRFRALWRGFAGMGALGVALLMVRRAVLGSLAGTFTADSLAGLGIGGRTLTMLKVVPEWLRLFVWPAHLRSDYSPMEFTASTGVRAAEVLGFGILTLTTAAFYRTRKSYPVVAFGIAWTSIALLPVCNVLVPTGILIAERVLFLPSIGIAVALAGATAAAWPRLTAHRPRLAGDLGFACAAIVAIGILRSAERQRIWRNEAVLAARSVQDAPYSFRAEETYANMLFDFHEPKLALEAYQLAFKFAPPGKVWRVHNDLARQYRAQGNRAGEAEQLTASLALAPDQEETRGYLIAAELVLGRYRNAVAVADVALAHGAPPVVFHALRSMADSADRVDAPAGSINIHILTEDGHIGM